MKTTLYFLFILLSIHCWSCHSEATKLDFPNPPNVILIMTDDQGWGDFSINGNDSIDTPVLDQMAREGVSFDRFFVSPLCAPTRASLLSGRYHLRTGVSWVTHRKEVMRSEEETIAEALKKAGYRTGIFGKWHNGEQYPNHPNGQGFDEFLGFCAGHWNNYFDPNLFHNDQPVKKEGFINDVFTTAAIDWMTQKRDQPFFCYIPYNTPHSPFQVPDRYFDKYKAKGLTDKNACVHGMCENIDDNVGRILQHLDSMNIAENTLVIFLTDNGPNGQRYNGGMRGSKGSVHEGGMRVPLFMRWPGRLPMGKVIRPITAHIDLLPTILEMCGVARTGGKVLDGRSLVPLIQDAAPTWADRSLYHIQTNGKRSIYPGAIRTEQYRFVLERDSSLQLYDMQKDPAEQRDLAEAEPQLVAAFKAEFEQWFAAVTEEGIAPPPILVGHLANHSTLLPAPEAQLSGGLHFAGKMGWANDYIVDWTSAAGKASWPIAVAEAGTYDIRLQYVCQGAALGQQVRVSAGGASVEAEVKACEYPDFYPSPDRVERGEVYERDWLVMSLGKLRLEQGETRLSIEAPNLKRGSFLELKAVEVGQ